MPRIHVGLGLALAAVTSLSLALPSFAQPTATTFTVRIENISDAAGQTASNGTRWPFALSPGTWIVTPQNAPLFQEGKPAGSLGLENQAEDGNPAVLKENLKDVAHGVFRIPVGAKAADAIGPGGAYEFTLEGKLGEKLTLAAMFGQSNDLFYAFQPNGLPLFNEKGEPISGDITSQLTLWDAGTEVNQEPGIGPDQAPRQKDANTGTAENGVVRLVKDSFTYPTTTSVLKVTITHQ